jgi:hypothetical protein
MIEAFVVLVAVVDSRPGMPWIAVSMGVDTSLLTTSGEAPGYGRQDRQLRELDRRDELLLEVREGEAAEDRRDDRDQGDQRPVLQAQDGEMRHGRPLLSEARTKRSIHACIRLILARGQTAGGDGAGG